MPTACGLGWALDTSTPTTLLLLLQTKMLGLWRGMLFSCFFHGHARDHS